MSSILRGLLIFASVAILYWILHKIRKAKVKMEDAIFWMIFSGILIILAVFPQIAYGLSHILSIISPANLIFLVMIWILVIKVFSLSVSVSLLEEKISILSAEMAIRTQDCQKKLEKIEGKEVDEVKESVL